MFLCENDRFERFDQSSTLKSDFVHKNIEIVDKVVLTMIRFIENMIFSTRYICSFMANSHKILERFLLCISTEHTTK